MTQPPDSARTKSIMGIDLGTTNSCVAIPCEGEGNASVVVVTDAFDRSTIPSVVYRDVSGKYLVGHNAKQKMGLTPPPVAFIKRYMGKDHHVKLGEESLTPEQVSSIILRHLRDLVQDKLGVGIDQVVITIPARFDLAGQQATVEAARLAGLEVLATMPEPVAAALAYGLDEEADDLKIFCYDLGGGTFDATVLVKSSETGIDVLAWDGDEHLGGFNFDTDLAKWILERLNAKGYSLHLDWNQPADQVRFQKLMRIAEKAKIALSEQPDYIISEREVFEDHRGNTVDIEIQVTRPEYERLIMPLLERTIELSARAITKAGLTPAQIDRVIMVGGSSRLPILHEMLKNELGRVPQLVDPDKIVARGAAVKAGTIIGSTVSGIKFLVPLPTKCSLDKFDIQGLVTLPQSSGVAVTIERLDGGYDNTTITDDDGAFRFAGVELEENNDNEFELRVGEVRAPALTHRFQVRQDPEAVALTVETNFITNEIGLLLSTGPKPIFREGERIPRETITRIGTVQDGQLEAKFEVYHGSHVLGDVTVKNLPPGLPKESPILVSVRIDDTLAISGKATLMQTGASAEFTFRVEKPKLPTAKQMRDRLAMLDGDLGDALSHISDNAVRTREYGQGQRLIRDVRKVLDAEPCDVPHASRLLDELSLFIGNLSRIDVLEPSWDVFAGKLADAKEQARRAENQLEKARRAGFTSTLNGIEAFATQAYKDRNKDVWQQANTQLEHVLDEIDTVVHEDSVRETIEKLTPEQRAELFKRSLMGQLQQAQARVNADPRLRVHDRALRQCISDVNDVNPLDPGSAFEELQRLKTRIEELMKKLVVIGKGTMEL